MTTIKLLIYKQTDCQAVNYSKIHSASHFQFYMKVVDELSILYQKVPELML
jgi:hypothetical protein